LTIQNSQGKIDTVIAFTNEQVIKRNQEHVILKECIEYSNLVDSQLVAKELQINKLESINIKLQRSDSLSQSSIKFKNKIIDLKESEKEQLSKIIVDNQKKYRKEKIKTWLYSTFITTPLVISVTAVATYFIIK